MDFLSVACFAFGIFLLTLTFWDLFETVVVPRPTPGWFRIARYLVRGSWRVIRAVRDGRPEKSYDRLLGLFAPAATIGLLLAWLVTLILGYGLVFFAIRDQLKPPPTDLGDAMYFAATSLLTLGFGDFVASGAAARIFSTIAAITGLGAVALVVTFLFSLFGSYQRRERRVVTLQAAAGAPPSAVALLETYAQLGLVDQLPELFREWEDWAVEVLDSHIAYPLLAFFRSSHDDLSWISALGTVLDAASFVLTTIDGPPRGQAKLFKRVGTHLVEDIYYLGFQTGDPVALDRSDFEAACYRLQEAGYRLEPQDAAWEAFEAARATYAPRLEVMARYLAMPATQWLGDPVALRQPLHPVLDP